MKNCCSLLLSSGEQPSECPEISRSLLENFGSLSAVFAAEKERLSSLAYMSSKMVGRMKAVQSAIERVLHEPIKENPIIGSWTSLTNYLKVTLRHKTTEHLIVLYLDRKNRLIRNEVHQQGTVDHTPALSARDRETRSGTRGFRHYPGAQPSKRRPDALEGRYRHDQASDPRPRVRSTSPSTTM